MMMSTALSGSPRNAMRPSGDVTCGNIKGNCSTMSGNIRR